MMFLMRQLKPIIFLTALLPMALVIYQIVNNQLGPDPAKALALISGKWAIRFLLLTLLLSSLARIRASLKAVLQFRRMLGLFAFFYASMHLLVFIVLLLNFDVAMLLSEINKRPYITVGTLSWLLLLPLALTSNTPAIKRLGGMRWRKLHRLVYVSVLLAIIHVVWRVRSDWSDALLYTTLALCLGLERIGLLNKKQA